jgi:FkbM family methyltransferase
MPHGKDDLAYEVVSYAINAEDVLLLRAFLDHPDGFFVDVGAGDPVDGSVTKNLVDRLGWHGVNIEPLPDLAEALARARPKDVTLPIAIGRRSETANVYRVVPEHGLVGGSGLSTLDPAIAAMHRETGWAIEPMRVEVAELDEVLEKYAEPSFDLLKIDVEGTEADVLASVDLARWRPRVIVVEATVPDSSEPRFEEWQPEVIDAGYRLALFDGLNRFYVRKDETVLYDRLSVPANVFDHWIPVAWARKLGLELRPDCGVGPT